ncbi:MAG: hypothetical protein Q8O86_01585 [Dehalococcoidia bacterium]|nr:hypothetical protein [Dehalococcoidia bacterium]
MARKSLLAFVVLLAVTLTIMQFLPRDEYVLAIKPSISSDSPFSSDEKPIVSYLLLQNNRQYFWELQSLLSLTQQQVTALENVIRQEQLAIYARKDESRVAKSDPNLTPEEIRQRIGKLDHSNKSRETARSTRLAIQAILNAQQYQRFVEWVEAKWKDVVV